MQHRGCAQRVNTAYLALFIHWSCIIQLPPNGLRILFALEGAGTCDGHAAGHSLRARSGGGTLVASARFRKPEGECPHHATYFRRMSFFKCYVHSVFVHQSESVSEIHGIDVAVPWSCRSLPIAGEA